MHSWSFTLPPRIEAIKTGTCHHGIAEVNATAITNLIIITIDQLDAKGHLHDFHAATI